MVRSIVHPPAASATHPVEGRAQLVLAERSVLYMYVSGHGDKVRLEEEGALDGRPAQSRSTTPCRCRRTRNWFPGRGQC